MSQFFSFANEIMGMEVGNGKDFYPSERAQLLLLQGLFEAVLRKHRLFAKTTHHVRQQINKTDFVRLEYLTAASYTSTYHYSKKK